MNVIVFKHDVEDTKEMRKFLADIDDMIKQLDEYLAESGEN